MKRKEQVSRARRGKETPGSEASSKLFAGIEHCTLAINFDK